MKKSRRIIVELAALLLLACCVLALLKFGPTVLRGVELYEKTMSEHDVEAEITELRSDDDYVEIDEISSGYLKALLRAEDRRFYYHFGIDPIALVRAVLFNLTHDTVQGASTITQQLCKNLFYSTEQSYERKIAEAISAMTLERLLSKDDILELYCNVVYFGEDCYGIKEATEHYYGVEPCCLNETQIDALVITLRAPSVYNPNALASAA